MKELSTKYQVRKAVSQRLLTTVYSRVIKQSWFNKSFNSKLKKNFSFLSLKSGPEKQKLLHNCKLITVSICIFTQLEPSKFVMTTAKCVILQMLFEFYKNENHRYKLSIFSIF